MKNNFLIAVIIAISVSGCESKKATYEDAQIIYDEAILIHDEVMPYMGKIMDLQKELKVIKSEISDESEIDLINHKLQDLENAHNAMMRWMRTLTPIPNEENKFLQKEDNSLTSKEMIDIQKKALENIKKVKELMNISMDEAENLIADYKK